MVPAVAQVTVVVAGWIPGPGNFHMPWVQWKKEKKGPGTARRCGKLENYAGMVLALYKAFSHL